MVTRVENEGANRHLETVYPVLNNGHLTLLDYLGTDANIVAAARISNNRDDRLSDEAGNRKLISYLMKHQHWSPFEQVEMVFDIKAPLWVIAEVATYRTANRNQISGRYTELPEEFWIPELSRIQAQSTTNKQASGLTLDAILQAQTVNDIESQCKESFATYHRMLDRGVAREIARTVLPQGAYSRLRWKNDLRNILHFLNQRTRSDAQPEIQALANQMDVIVKDAFPLTHAAWYNFIRGAVSLSYEEIQQFFNLLASEGQHASSDYIEHLIRYK